MTLALMITHLEAVRRHSCCGCGGVVRCHHARVVIPGSNACTHALLAPSNRQASYDSSGRWTPTHLYLAIGREQLRMVMRSSRRAASVIQAPHTCLARMHPPTCVRAVPRTQPTNPHPHAAVTHTRLPWGCLSGNGPTSERSTGAFRVPVCVNMLRTIAARSKHVWVSR